MDDEPPEKRYPPSVSKMSKTPSWVMLGFVLGALFVLALPSRRSAPQPPPAPVKKEEPPSLIAPRTPPSMTRIEAVFEEWGKYAIWHEDTTEVALWDPADERYSEFYEARRLNGALYFRSIPQLTRRPINDRGREFAGSPLMFTETEEQFREWDERDRARRPLERMWTPPPPKLPDVQPQMPSVSLPPAPEAERITPPAWEPVRKPAPAEKK